MAALLLFSLVAVLSCTADGAPGGLGIRKPAPRIPRIPRIARPDVKVFNVLTYGAVRGEDTTNIDTNVQAFMDAWNAACHWRGRARVVIPAGTFLVGQVMFHGPCVGPPPITVQMTGIVKADTDITNYPSPEWFSFDSINGIVITGGGTFDGQGAADWKYDNCAQDPKGCQLMAANVKFNKITNGQIRRINSINSKAFHYHINNCQNLGLRMLTITAPQNSPNTDGIHISESNSVGISNTVIGTGDDCISIGQGATNINITGVKCGPGHGISVGSLGKYKDEKDVRGLIVKNCTLSKTENGVRIKTWIDSQLPPTHASGFLFEDIIMDNVRNPIIIDQKYCAKKECGPKPVSDVQFRNIRGTSSSPIAVNIECSSQVPCQNVQFFNIDLKSNTSAVPATSSCVNAKLGYSGIQNPPPCKSS